MTKSEEVIGGYDRYVIPSYARFPIVLVRGKGVKVWDADGKVYLDFLGGIAVNGLGHSHPRVVQAIRDQAETLTHVSNLYYNANQAALAKALSEVSLGGKCFFCNSGAEANEALIKLARLWGHARGRYEVVCMENSFHGRTLATLAATGQAKYREGFEPIPIGFAHARYNDLESVRAAVNDRTVAVLVEAVQGEGGVIPSAPGFLAGLRALCDEKDILLLCDEVQCGMGRTGHWFGFQAYDVKPDAFSLAKSLGNGFPIGALVTSPKLADVFQPGKHASTFGGTPLACAAALAVVQTLREEGLVARAQTAGDRFHAGLKALAERYEHVVEARGLGLMQGLVLDQSAKPMAAKLMDMGLLCLATADTVLRFLPPLIVKDAEIDEALDMLDDALAEWHRELSGEPAPVEDETPQEAPAAAPETTAQA